MLVIAYYSLLNIWYYIINKYAYYDQLYMNDIYDIYDLYIMNDTRW